MSLAYVSSPYTHADPEVMKQRLLLTRDLAKRLRKKGWRVRVTDYLMDICDVMIIYTIEGWTSSDEMKAEQERWGKTDKPVVYLSQVSELPEPFK